MKINDRLFIFVSVVLILLFAANVLDNIFFSTEFIPSKVEGLEEYEDTIPEIVTRLEDKGLEPQEAEYYRVIDE